jgi:steroid delta-isomerase-like uncharacterized protein
MRLTTLALLVVLTSQGCVRDTLEEQQDKTAVATASIEENKNIVRRYYHDLWNKWDLGAADELIATNMVFRGSLGVNTQGLEGFKQYVQLVRNAFPDFSNHIEDLIGEGDKVVARLTYRATHRGEVFGIAATGRQITYSGVAIFRIADRKIVEGWVLGDTAGLMRQLGATLPGQSSR